MSVEREQRRRMPNSAQPELQHMSGTQGPLEVRQGQSNLTGGDRRGELDVHSATAKGNQDGGENFDNNDNIRKATTSQEITIDGTIVKDSQAVGKKSSFNTSINTGQTHQGMQSFNERSQRFAKHPTSSFSVADGDVTPKSDLNMNMQPHSTNQSQIETCAREPLTDRLHENKDDSSPKKDTSEEEEEEEEEEDSDSSSTQARHQRAARRIAALLKGEKFENDAEDELEDCILTEEEEELDESYEEGIFVFRSRNGACLNCQIPVDEEVYLENYLQADLLDSAPQKEQWEYASKIVVYDRMSLYLFHHQHYFRRLMVNIIENKNFDNFIILMIFCNSMCMAIYDYNDRKNECTKNIILEQFSFVFTMVFNVECIFKIIGMGFFMHKNSYLRLDMWNWLDFCVVLVGIIEILPFNSGSVNMKGLRTLRVLRPLKSIKSLPAMRKLIGSLGSSIGPLTNVVVFLLFVFLLFGILGVTQFEGQMYQRCRLTMFPVEVEGEMVWPFDPEIDRLCSVDGTGRQCPTGQICGTPVAVGLPISSDKPETQELINYGVTTFDHLGHAMIVIFQMITLEGWVLVMYNLQDAGAPWLATAYCILLVIICAFFVLNVILAVLGDALSGQDDENESPEEQKKKIDTGRSMRRARIQKERLRGPDFDVAEVTPNSNSRRIKNSQQMNSQSPSPSNSKMSYREEEVLEPFQNTPAEIELNPDMIQQRSLSVQAGEIEKNLDFQADSNEVDQCLKNVVHLSSDNYNDSKEEQPIQSDQLPIKIKIPLTVLPVVLEEIREEQSDAVVSYSHIDVNNDTKRNSMLRSNSLRNQLHTKANRKIIPIDESALAQAGRPSTLQVTIPKDDQKCAKNSVKNFTINISPNIDAPPLSPALSQGKTSGKSSQNQPKDDPDYLPKHASRNILFRLNYRLLSYPFFDTFITVLIIFNTFVLAMDRQYIGEGEKGVYDFCNDIFTWAFVSEMLIKLLGLGFTEYGKDDFNKFDAVIVVLSLVEFVLLNAGFGGNLGAFSALRGFRLMRVFKLARGWKDLRVLLSMMGKSIIGLSTFSVLMLIIIFIFMLLGMELFAFKIRYDDGDNPLTDAQPGGTSPRENFNTPWQAFITIFIVIVGDDWNTIMYSHYRVLMETSVTQGYIAVGFFIVLFIMGNLVLLNLFLAILLQNFDEAPNEQEEKEPEDDDQIQLSLKEKMSACCKLCCARACRCCKKDDESDNEAPLVKIEPKRPPETEEEKVSREADEAKKKQIFGRLRQLKLEIERRRQEEERQQSLIDSSRAQLIREKNVQSTDKKGNGSWKDDSSEESSSSEDIFGEQIPGNQQDVQTARTKKGRSSTKRDKPQQDRRMSASSKKKLSKSKTLSPTVVPNDDMKMEKSKTPPAPNSMIEKMKMRMQQKMLKDQEMSAGGSAMVRLLKAKMQSKIAEQEQREQKLLQMKQVSKFSIAKIKQLELKQSTGNALTETEPLEGNALFFFGPDNTFRNFVSDTVRSSHFDNGILLLILVSTVLLCMEQPLADPNGQYVKVLGIMDKITTLLFILECVFKVLTYGYACNGKNSYMTSSWNVLDFIIVFFSIFDLLPTGQDIGALKIIRLARVLRPLRMIARNEGMKIAIESLIMSIKGVGNVLIISILILLLFAILGTNFYKGLFMTCSFENVDGKQADAVHTMWECFDAGGEWILIQSNFDDVASSMITLFTAATTEGWVDVMKNAVDSSSYQVMPIQDNTPAHALFFIFFVLIMALFILNLFVGVVISKFNDEKERLAHNTLLTAIQLEYCDTMVKVYNAKPKVVYVSKGDHCMDLLQTVASSKYFDNFIFGCITVNTLCMAVTWYDEPKTYTDVMKKVNLAFAIIYTIECGLKLYVFRREYFKDGWNLFDFIIVLAAWLGLFADLVLKLNIGAVTTIIRSFRIARIFKMIKHFKQLNKIFNTFISALPQLGNIGTLLFLMLLLYAVAGVFFFSHVRFGDAITVHTNFQNWPNAMLTLLRCSTGEAFNELMWGLATENSIEFQCSKTIQTFQEIQESGGQPNGCGSYTSSTMFFISFIVLVSFIFINMFIAIILEGFDNSAKDQNMQINEDVIAHFIEAWSKYDLKGSGLIPADKLDLLVMDLILRELEVKGPERKFAKEKVLFNLSNDDFLLVYTKMKREVDLDTPFIKNFTRDLFKVRAINRYWNKFCWEFCVPSYCSFTRYNFHDILEALVKISFAVRHTQNYNERQQRIKLSDENGIPLSKFDRIQEDDEEFMRLPEIKMELFLETNNKDFSLVINRLEQIKGMRTKNKIAKFEKMKKMRIACGLPFKDQLDEYDGFIYDSAHVRACNVVIKHLLEKKERRRLAALPKVQNPHAEIDFDDQEKQEEMKVNGMPDIAPDQTSSKWEQTERSEGELDPTTAKKAADYAYEEFKSPKATCRIPYSDEKECLSEVRLVPKSLSTRDNDLLNTIGDTASNQQNVKRGIIAEDNNLTASQNFTNKSITNARIIQKLQWSRSPSKNELDQNLQSLNSDDQIMKQKSITSVLAHQTDAEIERVFQGFVAAADEKDKTIDEQCAAKYVSPLEMRLKSGDVSSSIGSLKSQKMTLSQPKTTQLNSMANIDDEVIIYSGPQNQQQESSQKVSRNPGHLEVQFEMVPMNLVSTPQVIMDRHNLFLHEGNRITMAAAAILSSSPYGDDQLYSARRNQMLKKAASSPSHVVKTSVSPRQDYRGPPSKNRMHSYKSQGVIATISNPSFQQPSHNHNLSTHEKILEIQNQEKYELMLAQRRQGRTTSRKKSRQFEKQCSLSPPKKDFPHAVNPVFYNSASNFSSIGGGNNPSIGSSYQQKAYAQMIKANSQPNKRQFFGNSQGFSKRILPKVIHNNFQKESLDTIVSQKDTSELAHYKMVTPIETTHMINFSQDPLPKQKPPIEEKRRQKSKLKQ